MESSSGHRNSRRSRSRSPHGDSRDERHRHRHHHGRHGKESRSSQTKSSSARKLPYESRVLTKRDFEVFKPMFALYLDIQKGKILEDLSTSEAKGRWKSFISRWNRGELAEGWYDPSTFQKAVNSEKEEPRTQNPPQRRPSPNYDIGVGPLPDSQESSDDEYGPALANESKATSKRVGPTIPSIQDLQYRREIAEEDAVDARDDLRQERRANRKLEKERLDELVPRAEAGTRERQLEKRKEVASSNKAFEAAKEGGDLTEVPESDLMGGDEGIEAYKKQKQEVERKKNEREIRKEEIARARKEERDERAREFREREERTMAGLIELAKKRYG